MKKSYKIGIGAVLLLILVVGTVLLLIKATAASKLKLGDVGMRIDQAKAKLTTVLGGKLPFFIDLDITNYSPVNFLLNQISIEIFSTDGKKIGGQTLPLSSPITILPNKPNTVSIPFEISIGTLTETFKDVSLKTWTSYYYTGSKIGKKIVIKGFVVAEAIKMNIDKEVEI